MNISLGPGPLETRCFYAGRWLGYLLQFVTALGSVAGGFAIVLSVIPRIPPLWLTLAWVASHSSRPVPEILTGSIVMASIGAVLFGAEMLIRVGAVRLLRRFEHGPPRALAFATGLYLAVFDLTIQRRT